MERVCFRISCLCFDSCDIFNLRARRWIKYLWIGPILLPVGYASTHTGSTIGHWRDKRKWNPKSWLKGVTMYECSRCSGVFSCYWREQFMLFCIILLDRRTYGSGWEQVGSITVCFYKSVFFLCLKTTNIANCRLAMTEIEFRYVCRSKSKELTFYQQISLCNVLLISTDLSFSEPSFLIYSFTWGILHLQMKEKETTETTFTWFVLK